ncbi:IS3 family transposase [Chlamydiota bacterium]
MRVLGLCYSIGMVCRVFGYSRQGYYKRIKLEEKREEQEKQVLEEVRKIRKRQPCVGVKKIHKELYRRGKQIGRDRLFETMRRNNLLIRPRRNYVRTTNSKHRFRAYNNLIREIQIIRPEQVYASDITYIATEEGYSYLSLITDMYSRKIVGYELSKSLGIEGSMKALKKALRGVKKTDKLIHHSDRGIQYCSNEYVKLLKKKKIKISMTEENHVYENALAERVNGILKNEFGLGKRLRSYKIAKKMVKEAVEIYNKERLHMSLKYETPSEKHAA